MPVPVRGVVQVTAVPGFLRAGRSRRTVGIAEFADHIEYAVQPHRP